MRLFKNIKKKSPHYSHLSKKWATRNAQAKENLWQKHKESLHWLSNLPGREQLAAGSLSGLLMLSSGSVTALPIPTVQVAEKTKSEYMDLSPDTFFYADLTKVVPQEVRPLTTSEEEQISQLLSKKYGVRITAELDGKRLNRSYGYIGAEQHLMRYPGDTIEMHFSTTEEANQFARFGMAPGRGAWGYFTTSQETLTQTDIDREKYYIAVQTFLSPGFMENVREQYDFYRFRKMLVVNPDNGKAMVVVVGDAGPAAWTGKHLGGSPEVMRYLERVDGRAKGPVLYFFIDDPDDSIPLGPLIVQ